ncbi:uncharacterized protein LOC132902175 [Amyelois transitella]|uniref:uncharacterized protein LOC132902175 n=1 Tax=Amyelois transitella TaxID=680683 RepID=UPI0029907A55|nr:uncharacterized protein LOC132902175 [Amyelois transitella]
MANKLLKCSTCNIVINEVLAFVSNKIDVMDEDSIAHICVSAFSENDILDAKNLLFESVPTTKKKKQRKRNGKTLRNIDDIICLLKETDPEEIPIFVARELQKLPPVLFDHVDVTRILKDLLKIQQDVNLIKSNYVTSEQLSIVKDDIQYLKHTPLIENNNCNINNRRGACLIDSFSYNSGPMGLHPLCENTIVDINDHQHSTSSPKLVYRDMQCPQNHSTDQGNILKQTQVRDIQEAGSQRVQICDGAAAVTHARAEPVPATAHSIEACDKTSTIGLRHTVGQPDKTLVEDRNDDRRRPILSNEEWTLVQKKRRRYKFAGMRGKAMLEPEEKFKAADVKTPIYIYNVGKEVTENDICDYIKKRANINVTVEKVVMKVSKDYQSYKIFVPKHHLGPETVIRNPSIMGTTKLVSFNCKCVRRSLECIRRLCSTADVIALQETWLLPEDIAFLDTIDEAFSFTGKSAVDMSAGILKGRPYGGVALLWRKAAFPSVSVVQCRSDRISAIKIMNNNRSILIFSVYMPTDSKDNLPEFTDCLGEIYSIIESYNIESAYVLGDFNWSDVIRKMTRGKSPGHDGLSIEHLKYAGVHLPRVLALFFNFCLSHSYLPEDLMRTLVVPIVKNKTGDVSDLSNYRPISLATIVAKVLDSLLDKQLEKNIKLHDAQFGFRPKLSTESAILCLKQTVHYYTARNTPVYACYLDFSKAFDLVNYEVLWGKLDGLPSEVTCLLKYWYSNQQNTVRWAGTFSDEYRLQCGVRQGGLSSPRLFNLYINSLIGELTSTGLGCSIDGTCINNISYADDMVLLSPSVGALRRMLSICERYALTHGLRYNAKKSEFMVFKAGSKQYKAPAVTLCGTPLHQVSSFKYLGHWITETMSDDVDIERERRALSVRCNMLARRFARCTSDVKITLFKSYCQSLYTCGLWVRYARRAYGALRVQYNNGFRAMLGLPRWCSASAMFAEAHTQDFFAVIRARCASLLNRLRRSTNTILITLSERWDSPFLQTWTMYHTLRNKR